jgi:predicted nucleic acid-binding Zn ribbon protein
MAKPKPIGNIVAELLARRGYGRLQAADGFATAWRQAAGDGLAARSRAGQVRRGVLEVWVENSTLVQEMSFEKSRLLKIICQLLPDEKIRDLKFRVGPID